MITFRIIWLEKCLNVHHKHTLWSHFFSLYTSHWLCLLIRIHIAVVGLINLSFKLQIIKPFGYSIPPSWYIIIISHHENSISPPAHYPACSGVLTAVTYQLFDHLKRAYITLSFLLSSIKSCYFRLKVIKNIFWNRKGYYFIKPFYKATNN